MRREIIQDFLNVPGIVGVAVMSGSSTPYFCGFEAESPEINLSQQLSVTQSIQQVLETTPEGFNAFEFQFDSYRAYLHKLNRGTTLLVLTINHLSRPLYTQSVRRLLLELQIGQADPISELRTLELDRPAASRAHPPTPTAPQEHSHHPGLDAPLAANGQPAANHHTTNGKADSPSLAPLSPTHASPPVNKPAGASGQLTPPGSPNLQAPSEPSTGPASDFATEFSNWAERLSTHADSTDSPPAHPMKVGADHQAESGIGPVGFGAAGLGPAVDAEPLAAGSQSSQSPSESPSLKDVLAAINRLSQLTAQYLGTLVVSNYWKATRPAEDWLSHFQIERSAQITFAVQMPSQRLPILTPGQHQSLKTWVAAFLERCSKVIREFSKIVCHTLTSQQTALLFG